MDLEKTVQNRSGHQCELCGAKNDLKLWEVPPQDKATEENNILICNECLMQVEKKRN